MADVDIRAADVRDAQEIARIQILTWRTAYGQILPAEVLAGLDEATVAHQWQEAIGQGPATVLVATESDWVVGFGAAGPAPADETADAAGQPAADAPTVALVSALVVEPRWGRRGHGGRLLAALADAMRAPGLTRGISWVPEADAASLGFYRRAGWTPDGTVRTLDAGGRTVRELRVAGPLEINLA